jgi:predicted lipid carrier protein YhbT
MCRIGMLGVMDVDADAAIPAVSAPLGFLLGLPPLLPLRFCLRYLAESVQRRHPALRLRLAEHADKTFLIDPVDLPFVFRLRVHPARLLLEPQRREQAGECNARIAGRFAALIGMIHGAYDGDALFFSRDIVVAGDTEAVLALRNALDDAELDLGAEITAAFGPAGPVIERVAAPVLPAFSRLTGFHFIRADGR